MSVPGTASTPHRRRRWRTALVGPQRVEVQGASLATVDELFDLSSRLRDALTQARSPRGGEQRPGNDGPGRAPHSVDADLAPASLIQAERVSARRRALMATGAWSLDDLQQARGDELASSTRTCLSRQRARHALFSVAERRRTLVPAFLMTIQGTPEPELQPLLEELDSADVGGWQKWTWLTAQSSALGGRARRGCWD